jgi:hypothetical protein
MTAAAPAMANEVMRAARHRSAQREVIRHSSSGSANKKPPEGGFCFLLAGSAPGSNGAGRERPAG